MSVEKEVLLQRLHTAERHLHAVSRMLENDFPCQQILHQLNEVQCVIEDVGSMLVRIEVERCSQAIREESCPEQRCEQLARLMNLYPFAVKFPFILFRDIIEVKR